MEGLFYKLFQINLVLILLHSGAFKEAYWWVMVHGFYMSVFVSSVHNSAQEKTNSKTSKKQTPNPTF